LSEEHQEPVEENIQNSNQEGSIVTVLNLSLVTLLVLLGLSMVSPILPTYAESFDVTYTLVGFVISSFAIARMVLDMPAGILSRKFDKKKIMILGLVLISTSSVLAGVAPNYVTLIIARMIEGAGSALYVTTARVFLIQMSGEEKRGQYMSPRSCFWTYIWRDYCLRIWHSCTLFRLRNNHRSGSDPNISATKVNQFRKCIFSSQSKGNRS